MKKTTIIICICLFVIQLNLKSQTSQGKILLGVSSTLSIAGTGSNLMSIGYSSVSHKSDASGYIEPKQTKNTSINFLPKLGYFVINNLALGLDLSIAYSGSQKDGSDIESSNTILSAGPFLRYYVPTSKCYPFLELGGAYGSVTSKYDSGSYTDERTSSLLSVGGGAGVAFPLGDKVMFDLMLGYNTLTVKNTKDNKNNERTVYGTFGLEVGFVVLLGSKK